MQSNLCFRVPPTGFSMTRSGRSQVDHIAGVLRYSVELPPVPEPPQARQPVQMFEAPPDLHLSAFGAEPPSSPSWRIEAESINHPGRHHLLKRRLMVRSNEHAVHGNVSMLSRSYDDLGSVDIGIKRRGT